jgi:hypothetical protein
VEAGAVGRPIVVDARAFHTVFKHVVDLGSREVVLGLTQRGLCVKLAAAALMALTPAIVCAQVCDLELMDTVSAPGRLSEPRLVSDTAYVAAHSSGIVRIDVSKPRNLSVLGSDATTGPVVDLVYEFFDNMIVTAEGNSGVGTYSIGASGTTPIAVTDLGENIVSIEGFRSDFFAGSMQGTLFTVNFDSDNTPIEVGSVALGGEVMGVTSSGSRAYCALGSDGKVAIVDITSQQDPQLISTHSVGGNAKSIVKVDNYLYVAVGGTGIVVLEIDGDSLNRVGSLPLSPAPSSIIVQDDRLYAVGENLGLVEVDVSLTPVIVQIGKIAIGGASGVVVSNNRAYVGRDAKGFSTVNVDSCSGSGSSPVTSVIAASSRDVGGGGAYWVTDAAFANLGREPATVIVQYLAKDQDNGNPPSVSFALAAGQQRLFGDVYSTLFGLDSANGALRIIASYRDVKVTSRTYDRADPEATYGQFIPALTGSSAVVVGVPGGMPQCQQNARFKTNIGFVNLKDTDVKIVLHLFDADGVKLGERIKTLRPYEMIQYNSIFAKVSSDPVDSGFAMAEVLTSGGSVLAYASVIDKNSKDPINVPALQVTSGRPWLP